MCEPAQVIQIQPGFQFCQRGRCAFTATGGEPFAPVLRASNAHSQFFAVIALVNFKNNGVDIWAVFGERVRLCESL